jgi:hypothetical protein
MFPTGAQPIEGQPVPVYIWLTTEFDNGDISRIAIHEMAAMNRWCVPVEEPRHDYYSLYLALWIADRW